MVVPLLSVQQTSAVLLRERYLYFPVHAAQERSAWAFNLITAAYFAYTHY